MPSSFKAPCSLWRVFADFFSTYGVAVVGRWHLGTFLFCRQLGTLLASLVHWGQVSCTMLVHMNLTHLRQRCIADARENAPRFLAE